MLKPSREIRDLVLGYTHDVFNGDARAFDAISRSDAAVYIGTDEAEYWEGGLRTRALLSKQIKELADLYAAFGHTTPNTTDIKILAYEVGELGWAVCTLIADLPDGTQIASRNTYVLLREDRAWKIVHIHTSVPVPNESFGIELTTTIDEVADLVERERPKLDHATSPEGTVTIMFTDLESSTATNEALGDDAFLPLLLQHNEIVRRGTEEAHGTVVKSQGDGFMLAFSSARRAVGCAITIQRDVASVDSRLQVRIGLHTGEPLRQTEDFYGRDVAYAARIGSAAAGGEILVSGLVRSLVEPSGSVAFSDSRELELKGFDGLQTVHAVDWPEAEEGET